ncbi:MAG TPA: hypothetical protein ENK56_02790 [Chloroflexi bacterium]|nr:hypothetical protein [Chloroflexota bacterium]
MSIFSVHTTDDDVEAAMVAVADALRQWEGGEALPLDLSLLQSQGERLSQQAHQLLFQWNVDGNAIIHSTRPKVGPWIIRFQVVVRRLTWWFLEPILHQIRLFQRNTAHVVHSLTQNQEQLAAHIAALEAQVEALQRRLEAERQAGGRPRGTK